MTQLSQALIAIRQLQTFALNIGAIPIECSTASGTDRAEVAALLREFIGGYCAGLQGLLALPEVVGAPAKTASHLAKLTALEHHLSRFNPAQDFADLTPQDAGATARLIRTETMPAILSVQSYLRGLQKAQTEREAEAMGEKAEALETMFTEVEQIGRMIHLISLNASVEAARAGGESGRSFKVIADEIRTLATRSAQLIETTRDTLAGETPDGYDSFRKAG